MPDGTFVGLESDFTRLVAGSCRIVAHRAYLKEAFTVAAGDLRSIIVELTVVDVVFVFRID